MKGFQVEPYENWLKQAKETIRSAESDMASEFYSWACFKAQQAAEYCLKGFLHGMGLTATGHSVLKLAEIVSVNAGSLSFNRSCLVFLDKLYIPTRYADVYDDGSPFSYYEEEDAKRALSCANEILDLVSSCVSTLETRESEEET